MADKTHTKCNVIYSIKIVKKFKKTFKGQKMLEGRTVCGDGKVATEMALEMVSFLFASKNTEIYSRLISFYKFLLWMIILVKEEIFSAWFCQGNIIEARAKMLAKKEMGWKWTGHSYGK